MFARVKGRLLYLPTPMSFPIGGKRVMCRRSKLTNSLGRTKLVNSLEKQQHEQIYKPAGDKQTISSQFSLVLSWEVPQNIL